MRRRVHVSGLRSVIVIDFGAAGRDTKPVQIQNNVIAIDLQGKRLEQDLHFGMGKGGKGEGTDAF